MSSNARPECDKEITPSWRHRLAGDTTEKTLPSKGDRRARGWLLGAHNRTSLCQREAPELTGLTWPTLTGLAAFHCWGLRMFFSASKALVSAFCACFCHKHIPCYSEFVKFIKSQMLKRFSKHESTDLWVWRNSLCQRSIWSNWSLQQLMCAP